MNVKQRVLAALLAALAGCSSSGLPAEEPQVAPPMVATVDPICTASIALGVTIDGAGAIKFTTGPAACSYQHEDDAIVRVALQVKGVAAEYSVLPTAPSPQEALLDLKLSTPEWSCSTWVPERSWAVAAPHGDGFSFSSFAVCADGDLSHHVGLDLTR